MFNKAIVDRIELMRGTVAAYDEYEKRGFQSAKEDFQFSDDNGASWNYTIPNFIYGVHYRVTPKTVNVPWHLIDEKWKYFAIDSNGNSYVYSALPLIDTYSSRWKASEGGTCADLAALKIDIDGIDWTQSLIERK